MEITQLLPASTTSPASKGPQGTTADGEDFARMLKQSGEAASGKGSRDATATSNSGDDSLAKTTEKDTTASEAMPESGADSTAQQSEALVPGAVPPVTGMPVAGSPTTRSPAAGSPAGLSPLTQNIAQAMSAQITSQPTQPPVIASTLNTTLQASQATLNASETLDLAAIRERLTTIANAQRGAATLAAPAAAGDAATLSNAGQFALDIAKASLPQAGDRLTSIHGQAAAAHHQPLTAQGMNPVGTQDPSAALPTASQPATFMDAIATSPATPDLAIAGRGGAESHASQVQALAGNLTGASTGSAGQTQASPAQVLNAPLATPQWQQGLGQQLVALHQRGAQQMELHLRPADLGPLSISLKVDDQLAQLQLFSTNPQVRAAIEQAIPQLRQALEENGIQLGEAMVGEQRQQHDGDSRSADDTGLASRDDDLRATSIHEDLDVAATVDRPLAGNGNAVDLYA
ncbi:flagellar hook-length control protein FliK [Modicisalibacter muralis]|uniref:Flagellar hook-length control protein FliK n=1 Tax=Modicisalibacter muralis TaxID=119000 RepID=A0A1G9FUQ9_9GAMM|nr:flagellar hook-length control protein FliK [Halomonas muralis]SDK92139.1 flagellar hook-length control protein FliK [Halomonas muralis]